MSGRSSLVRPGPWLATAATALFALARPLPAQDTAATLRGAVTDTAGTPVPCALVRILPVGAERFTDARGGFAFAGLRLGSCRLQARQVGYEPSATSMDLGAEGASVRGARARSLELPSLQDLADSAFVANHCFGYGGTAERDGRRGSA